MIYRRSLSINDAIFSLFKTTSLIGVIPEPTARSAVPGVSPGRGLLNPLLAKFKSLSMGDGDKIFMVCHDVMLTDLNNITDYRVEWF